MGSSAIAIAIAALMVLSLSSLTLSRVVTDEEVDEYVVDPLKFYLDCFALHERFELGDSFSDDEREYLSGCGQSFGFMGDAYRAIGRLPPAYVEALRRRFDCNQTLIDRAICFLENVNSPRCANHTGLYLYHDFLQYDCDDD